MSNERRGKVRKIKLRIAICDDEEYYRKHIQELVANHLEMRDFSYEITLFQSGEDFCKNGMNLVLYDIIFLDIEMGLVSGMDVAHEIRKSNDTVAIVFITVMADYVYEGYEVEASRYIMKNDLERQLARCMDSLLEKRLFRKKKLRFHFINGDKDIILSELIYIESNLHKLCFVTTEGKWYQYNTLDELEKTVSAFHFIRCHQSFLVNAEHIEKVKSYIIFLTDGMEIPVAKARYPQVKQCFLAYKEIE